MIMLKDSVIEEILKFLDQCEGILLIQSVPPISLSLSLSLSFHFISIWAQRIISGGTASGTESDPSGSKHRHL